MPTPEKAGIQIWSATKTTKFEKEKIKLDEGEGGGGAMQLRQEKKK